MKKEPTEREKKIARLSREVAFDAEKCFTDNLFTPPGHANKHDYILKCLLPHLQHIATVFNHVQSHEKRELVYHLVYPHIDERTG